MLKFFAKCFESVCCFLAVVNIILCGAIGAFCGYALAVEIIKAESNVGWIIMLALAGVCIGVFIDVFTFGFIAQIIEIRRMLEEKE